MTDNPSSTFNINVYKVTETNNRRILETKKNLLFLSHLEDAPYRF